MPVRLRLSVRVMIVGLLCTATLTVSGNGAEREKNHASVKAGFRDAAQRNAGVTVEIRGDGQPIALGTVVDADGYVVCKASLLTGALTCHLGPGRNVEAAVVGVSEEHDLALLRVKAEGLTPVHWRTSPAVPGTLVAALGADGQPLGIGVISAAPRRVSGPARTEPPRGWLGIGLGDGEAGLGVSLVSPRSAASQAGIQVGDRLQRINETVLNTMRHAIETIGSYPPGTTLQLVVQRGAEELKLNATLGKPPANQSPFDQWGGGPFSARRTGFPQVLPHDVAIQPSECGGPLTDLDGAVVGVNIARALRVTTYALPAETVQQLVTELRAEHTTAGRQP